MNSKKYSQTGFTLVELMVTLVIAAILLTVAIPSFREMVKNNRLSISTNEFVDIVQFARTEAIKREASVMIKSIDSSASSNEWGKGISVGEDLNGDGSLTGTEILRTVEAFDPSITLDSDGFDEFFFRPNGFTSLPGKKDLNLCDDRSGETGRQFQILVSGLIRSSTTPCP